MPLYLPDTSIWAWANKQTRPDIVQKLADRIERGEVCTCAPVVLETMHRTETGAEYARLLTALFEPLEQLPLSADAGRRAVEVQQGLAPESHGNHRRPAVHFLIAAVAEAAGEEVVLWFFDRDLRVICEYTRQPYEAEGSTGPGQ